MKFYEYLKEVNQMESEFDAYVGDVCMPATYVGEKDIYLDNPYLHEKYGTLLNAEVEIIKPKKEGDTEVCVIDDALVDLGVSFFYAAAGYVKDSEYKKLFVKDEAEVEEELNPICTGCERLGELCCGVTDPSWTECIYKKTERELEEKIAEIADKYGMKGRTDVLMLVDAYLRGNVSDTEVCKRYYRNRTVTFADVFYEAERVGVKEVVIYNRNPQYITDTPYYSGTLDECREKSFYASREEVENFHFRMDEEDSLLYIYFKRK